MSKPDELVEQMKALAEKQANERGDYLYKGSADPELVAGIARIEADAERIAELEGLVRRAENFANNVRGFDWNEDRCVMVAVHLAGDCRATLGTPNANT